MIHGRIKEALNVNTKVNTGDIQQWLTGLEW